MTTNSSTFTSELVATGVALGLLVVILSVVGGIALVCNFIKRRDRQTHLKQIQQVLQWNHVMPRSSDSMVSCVAYRTSEQALQHS